MPAGVDMDAVSVSNIHQQDCFEVTGVLLLSKNERKHTWQAMHGDSHSCKIYKPLPKQELINRLSGKHPRTPLTQISSVATHRSDAKLSTIIHDRALFLCASLVPQDHAILRNLPYEW